MLAGYAIVAFIGVHTSLVDIWVNVMSWLYKPQRYPPAPSRRAAPESIAPDTHLADWEMVLYLGFTDRRRAPRDSARGAGAEPTHPRMAAPSSNADGDPAGRLGGAD